MSVLNQMPALELVAVVDYREKALFSKEVPASAARYRTAGELWARGGIDLVCVATNGPSHAELAIAAMKAGTRFVMVEKPMACSVAECERMIQSAQETGTRLSVNQSRRHDPFYRWLRRTIRSGTWGQPRNVWIQRPGIGLGCLATHSFDLACFLTHAQVRNVSGWIDEPLGRNPRGERFVDPGGLVVMDLGPGLRAVISQIEDGAGPMSVEIDLTGARVRLDEKLAAAEIVERNFSVKPGPARPPVFRVVEPPVGFEPKPDLFSMLRGVLEELVADGPLECDPVHGRDAVEVLVAAHLSHRSGNVPISLPLLAREDRELWLPVT